MPRPPMPESPLTALPPTANQGASSKRRLSRAAHLLHTSSTPSSISSIDDVLPEPKRGLLDFKSSSPSAPSSPGVGRPPFLKEKRKRSASGKRVLGERSPNTLPAPPGLERARMELSLRDTPDAVFTITTTHNARKAANHPSAKAHQSNNPFLPPLPPLVNQPPAPAGAQPTNTAVQQGVKETTTTSHPSVARPSRPATRVFSPSPPPAVNLALLVGAAKVEKPLGFPYVQPQPQFQPQAQTQPGQPANALPPRNNPAVQPPAQPLGHRRERERSKAEDRERERDMVTISLKDPSLRLPTQELEIENVRISVRPIPASPMPFTLSHSNHLKGGKERERERKRRHSRKPPPAVEVDEDGEGQGPPSPPRKLVLQARRPPTPHPASLPDLERGTHHSRDSSDGPSTAAGVGVLAALAAYFFPSRTSASLPPPATQPGPNSTHTRNTSTLSSTASAATDAILAQSGGRGTYCPWPAAAFFSALVCWAWEVMFKPRAKLPKRKEAPISATAAAAAGTRNQERGQQPPGRPSWPEGVNITTEVELMRDGSHPTSERDITQSSASAHCSSSSSSPTSFASEIKRRAPSDPAADSSLPYLPGRNWREHREHVMPDRKGEQEEAGEAGGIWGAVRGAWRAVGGFGWGWGLGRGARGGEGMMRGERIV